jgi:histidine triad (HIT) family protein
MDDCLFCKIINGDIPTTKVYEDEYCLAFNDIDPKAPTHILVIPKEHYGSIHEVPEEGSNLFSQLFFAVAKIVKELKLDDNGYRLVINSGPDGGQLVDHIHVHLLAGRKLLWPAG